MFNALIIFFALTGLLVWIAAGVITFYIWMEK